MRYGAVALAASLFLVMAAAVTAWPVLRPHLAALFPRAAAPQVARDLPSPQTQQRTAPPAPSPSPAPLAGASPTPSAGASPTPSPSASGAPATAPSPPAPTPAPTASQPAPAPPTPTVSWSAWAGPGCSSSGTASVAFNAATTAGWHGTSANPAGYGGCASPRYSHQSGSTSTWKNTADWVFVPASGASSCTLSIYVANGTWATSVLYELYAGDTTAGFAGAPFASIQMNQHTYDAGTWVTTGPFPVPGGTIDLRLTDAGTSSTWGVVADVVVANCS
jgi:hypothetical protein